MALNVTLSIDRSSFNMNIDCTFSNGTSGIYGPSGAGKSTLFNCLAGLETPLQGKITLMNKTLFDSNKNINLPAYKRNIGLVFQDKLLFPHLTIEENIRFGESSKKEPRVSFNELIELLDISHILNEYPSQISGGETQRTAIARALCTSPNLLMLDEPFNAVDQKLRKSILPYLKKLQQHLKIPMLIISHDLPDIQKLTDTIYVMNRGEIFGGTSIIELLESRQTEDMFDLKSFTNTITINNSVKMEDGLYISKVYGKNDLSIICPIYIEDGDSKIVCIRPGEISLSKEFKSRISIQNQIQCTISKLIFKDQQVYVVLNSGLNIISQISYHACKQLDLKEGAVIYALFKAGSLTLH